MTDLTHIDPDLSDKAIKERLGQSAYLTMINYYDQVKPENPWKDRFQSQGKIIKGEK